MKILFYSLTHVITVLLSLTVAVQSSVAQKDTGKKDANSSKIEVMILGTYHFNLAPDFDNVMLPKQQKEITSVIASLTEFQPTKVALEGLYKDSTKFDSLYNSYRTDKHKLNSNERQQLGFRLAHRLGHKSIYTIDYKQPWPYGEVMSWARENRPEFIDFYKNWKSSMRSYQDSLMRHTTVSKYLEWLNSRDYRNRLKEVRMRRLELGAGSTYIGLKPLTSSYDRNLRIFANLLKYAESGDRIIVIFGASHGYFLREFVQLHPDMTLREVSDYLG